MWSFGIWIMFSMLINVSGYNSASFFFYCQMIVHGMDRPHFLYHSLLDRHLDFLFIMQIMNIHVQVFVQTPAHFSWVYAQKQNSWVWGKSMFNLFRNGQTSFAKWLYHFPFLPAVYITVSMSSHSHQHLPCLIFMASH